MKNALVILTAIAISLSSTAQKLPSVSGKTAHDKVVSLPADAIGKFTFLCFASSQKAQKDLEGWLNPVYNKFIAKTGIMDDMYDVNVFFIPVFSGANSAMSENFRKKLKEEGQEDIKPHVLFCNSRTDELMASLKMERKDTPYFFLLDKEGNIIYRTSGAFTEEKFDEIDDRIE